MEEEKKTWSWKRFFWVILVMVFIPNFFFGALAHSFSLNRPYVNVDYAFVMLIILLNQRFLGAAALFAVVFFDALGLVGQVFPILRFSDIAYVFSFVGIAPFAYKLAMAAVSVFFLVCLFLFLNKRSLAMKVEFLVGINVLVFTYLYSALFVETEGGQVWRIKEEPLLASQTVFGFDSRKTGFVGNLSAEGPLFGKVKVKGASSPWFEDSGELDKKILLVVSESWGVTDKKIQEAVLSPIRQKQELFSQWEQGVIGFRGITIEAEIRELCQLDLLHFNFEGHEEELSDCLPNSLSHDGYKTYAFHGAAGLMYDRVKWYPDVGFDESTFFENQTWSRRCYSFPGACDSDMADYVAKSLSQNDKVFSYWLTLNSHFTYDSRDIHSKGFQCTELGVAPGSQTCRNLKLHYQFFGDLARILKRPEMAGVKVVVVGDHEPPITNKEEKNRYFVEGEVPWLSLKVKDNLQSLVKASR